jgi:hypothetical protein
MSSSQQTTRNTEMVTGCRATVVRWHSLWTIVSTLTLLLSQTHAQWGGGGATIAREDAPRYYFDLYVQGGTELTMRGFLSENGKNVYVRYPVYEESGGAAREYVEVEKIERIEIGRKSTQGYQRHPMKVFLKGDPIPITGWLSRGFLVTDSGRMQPLYRIDGPAVFKRQGSSERNTDIERVKEGIKKLTLKEKQDLLRWLENEIASASKK